MKALIGFIKGIAEGIGMAIDFLGGLISDLAYMVGLLGKFVVQIPSYLSWLPPSVVAIFVTIFSIVVVYKIIGREG